MSGKLYPYQVRTNEIIGVANITSMTAYNQNPAVNSSVNGASLQLNVGLNTYVNNKLKVFWLQDVLDFNTSSDQYYLIDNIWNNTGPTSNISKSDVLGKGNVTVCQGCTGQSFYADTYPDYFFNYTLPLSTELIIVENQTPSGTQVSFGYQILQNGTFGVSPPVFFDNVTIPGSSNSTLLTTPYYQTPGNGDFFGNYYDSEFVFAGESNGADVHFNSLDSSVWMYYEHNGTLVPFPSVYTFGLSTAETASNLQTSPGENGALVTTGQQNLAEDIFTSNAINSFGSYLNNASKRSTVTTTVSAPLTQKNKISKDEIYAFIVIAAVSIVFIVIVGFLLMKKK